MSLLKNSRYTLFANIVNQLSALALFLAIPNIVSKSDYAQIVFVMVLLSFMSLSDLGMSFVYSRKMPSIYHIGDSEQIEIYNQTFFWFRFVTSCIGSVIIAVIYYLKYTVLLNSLLILLINPLTILVSFFIVQYSVREDFKVYQHINVKNALLRTLIIPLTYIGSLSGWFIGQVVALLLVIGSFRERVFFKYGKFDFYLIKKYLWEGLILLTNFFFWNQLLNSGRLYAAMNFQDEMIAQYGLTNAGYSLLLTLVISIFLPVTVASLKIMKTETSYALDQIFHVILKIALPLGFVVILSIELAPYLYQLFFSKYVIDFAILKYQLLSLMTLPLVATLGNVFTGMGHPIRLLLMNGVSFSVSYVSFIIMGRKSIDAAIAQCIGVTFLGLLLIFAVFFFYRNYIVNKLFIFIKIMTCIFLPYIIYWFLGR